MCIYIFISVCMCIYKPLVSESRLCWGRCAPGGRATQLPPSNPLLLAFPQQQWTSHIVWNNTMATMVLEPVRRSWSTAGPTYPSLPAPFTRPHYFLCLPFSLLVFFFFFLQPLPTPLPFLLTHSLLFPSLMPVPINRFSLPSSHSPVPCL